MTSPQDYSDIYSEDLADKLEAASSPVRECLERVLASEDISFAEGKLLFSAEGNDKTAICHSANRLRERVNGNRVSFVVNRNINFTNICYMGCRFCGFAKRIEDEGAEWLTSGQIAARAEQAWERGASEVCIQGGLHPKMPATYYRDILLAIKAVLPDIHIHAFSPFEIWYGATKSNMSYKDFLIDLKECGLGSMPGTAAEILDTEIRKKLTRNKLSAEKWVDIIKTAHHLGIRTSATIMYGHVDAPQHWAAHIALLRDIQKETGGFTELVPLGFIHTSSPLYTKNPDMVRPGPTSNEVDLMHAVSRIMLHGYIDNIQVSWTKLGAQRARQMLNSGVNDLGGTLMNESISRASGSKHGQEITAKELVELIRSADRIPVRRNSLYDVIDVFDDHDPKAIAPLVARQASHPLDFLKEEKVPNQLGGKKVPNQLSGEHS